MDFYLLIAGSRTYNCYEEFCKACDFILRNHTNSTIHIIEGEARGADSLARQYALDRGYQLHKFPADWNTYGKAAGYRRNEQMHKFISQFEHRGCICFWDGSSKGTQHNFGLSHMHNTKLRVYNYTSKSWVKV